MLNQCNYVVLDEADRMIEEGMCPRTRVKKSQIPRRILDSFARTYTTIKRTHAHTHARTHILAYELMAMAIG